MKFYKMNHEVTNADLQKFNFKNQRIGVIVHIEDNNGKILLQQRGVKSRDENGLYEDVGGSVENSDQNFKSAIIREMKEEMGLDTEYVRPFSFIENFFEMDGKLYHELLVTHELKFKDESIFNKKLIMPIEEEKKGKT